MKMGPSEKVQIEGMTCNHCVMNVRNAINSTGVKSVNVVLADNAAYIEGPYDAAKIKAAVENMGYKYIGN